MKQLHRFLRFKNKYPNELNNLFASVFSDSPVGEVENMLTASSAEA